MEPNDLELSVQSYSNHGHRPTVTIVGGVTNPLIVETQVREIMSSDLTIVTPREPIENCLRMMTEKRIRHLPVVEGDTLRGIISIGDLVKWVIASQSAAIAHLEHYISGGYSG